MRAKLSDDDIRDEHKKGLYKSGMSASMLKETKRKQKHPLQTVKKKNYKLQNVKRPRRMK